MPHLPASLSPAFKVEMQEYAEDLIGQRRRRAAADAALDAVALTAPLGPPSVINALR